MEIRPIKSEVDHELALLRIEQLIDAEPDTPEGDELDVLATLVEAYEDKHFPIEAPDSSEGRVFRAAACLGGSQPKTDSLYRDDSTAP